MLLIFYDIINLMIQMIRMYGKYTFTCTSPCFNLTLIIILQRYSPKRSRESSVVAVRSATLLVSLLIDDAPAQRRRRIPRVRGRTWGSRALSQTYFAPSANLRGYPAHLNRSRGTSSRERDSAGRFAARQSRREVAIKRRGDVCERGRETSIRPCEVVRT